MSEIQLFKLVTNETIISEVLFSDRNVVLINPLKLVMLESQNSRILLNFIPWIINGISSTNEFIVGYNQIVTYTEVTKDIEQKYYSTLEYFNKNEKITSNTEEEQELLQNLILEDNKTYH